MTPTPTIVVRALGLLLLAAFLSQPAGPSPGKSKWSEGKSNAGLIQASFKVLKAENGGTLHTYSGGVGPIVWEDLDLDRDEFDGSNFAPEDYTLVAIDKDAGTWTIQTGPATKPGGPPGYYRIHSDGTFEESIPASRIGGCGCPPDYVVS